MTDFDNLDHYAILDVSRNANIEQIKRAYRREMSKFHPDRFANGSAEQQRYASLRSQRINEAYRILSDFFSRSEYDRGMDAPSVRPSRINVPPPAPASKRDHQAELYEQAQLHLNAGQPVQALALLRKLQQINPFYRDSSSLLERAKEAVEKQRPARSIVSKAVLIAAGLGGTAILLAALFWAFGRERTEITASWPTLAITSNPITPIKAQIAPSVTDTTVHQPSSTILASATVVAKPTSMPSPTAMPSPTIVSEPTAQATASPVPSQASTGELLLRDTFVDGSWAQISGRGWRVGYDGNKYRIDAEPAYGFIWSYRSGAAGKRSYAIDVQVTNGEAGLMLRFNNENSYMAFLIDPAQGSYRVVNKNSRTGQNLASGTSAAIQQNADAINRIEARLSGDQLDMYINDQLIDTVSISDVPNSTRYGLIAQANTGSAVALFDNLEIRALP